MSDNTVQISEAVLQARALEIQKLKAELGEDYTSNPITDNKTGAIFTYTKDAATGEITCKYKYHNETPKDIILFQRATVPTSRAGLGYLNDAQFEEFKRNHPGHFYTTEYMAGADSIQRRDLAALYLNCYDKDTREQARTDYQSVVQEELVASGSFDNKAAKKMGKYARQDAEAGLRAGTRTVYFDKDQYEKAKKALKSKQDFAKLEIKAFEKSKRSLESLSTEDKARIEKAYATMEESVEYIKDKDVRKYIESHKEQFFTNGSFDQDKYKNWILGHLQGDNTMTTSEVGNASMVTGLSKGDMKRATKYAGYNVQKDNVVAIETTKTLVGLLAGPIVAYCTNANIHDVKNLKDILTIEASDPNNPNSALKILINGQSIATANFENYVRFRNVATRNAAIASALAVLVNNPLVDPKGMRDKEADGRTAATIATQNIFRGNNVVDLSGDVKIPGTPPTPVVQEEYKAEIVHTGPLKDQTVTFSVEAQKTGKTVTYEGKPAEQWKGHLWGALYAAYNVPEAEQAAFRRAYRKQYFNGATFYDNKPQTIVIKVYDPEKGQLVDKPFVYQYNNETREVLFNRDVYMSTWDYYVRVNKDGKYKSARVNEQGNQGGDSYQGSASMSVNGEPKASVQATGKDADETKRKMQADVDARVQRQEISAEQGQKLKAEIQNSQVTEK